MSSQITPSRKKHAGHSVRSLFFLTVSNAINSIDARRASSFLSFFLSFSFDNHHAVVRFLIRSTTDVYPGSKKFYLSRVFSIYDVYVRDIRNSICIIYIYITVSAIKALVSFFLISSLSFFYPFPLRI